MNYFLSDLFIYLSVRFKDVDSHSSSTGGAEVHPDGLIFIGKEDDIKKSQRITAKIDGREIVVFHHEGKFHALDSRCYRKISACVISVLLELSIKCTA